MFCLISFLFTLAFRLGGGRERELSVYYFKSCWSMVYSVEVLHLWGSTSLFVKKKMDLLGMCINYHRGIPVTYLKKKDIDISNLLHFESVMGNFKFQVMSFGLLMRLLWGDEEEHGKHLKIILELLKKERLYAKFSKCDFWLDAVQFLGHVIDHSGVHVNPAKIKAIRVWVAHDTPTEVVRLCLSLAGFHGETYNFLPSLWIDVPVVEPNQHNDVPVISEPVLVDEDEDPEEE
ncbi:hypothetical protein Tco_0451486 [Tanacetum coccineum]